MMIVSGSSFDSEASALWSLADLISDLKCLICNSEEFNNWFSCCRKNGLNNTHPGLVSRERQMWQMVMHIVKFMPIPHDYDGPWFKFKGTFTEILPAMELHPWQVPRPPKNPGVRILANPTTSMNVPKRERRHQVFAYGKFIYFGIY